MNYTRKGHILIDDQGKQTVMMRKEGGKDVSAINKAKRESRKLQANGHTVKKA